MLLRLVTIAIYSLHSCTAVMNKRLMRAALDDSAKLSQMFKDNERVLKQSLHEVQARNELLEEANVQAASRSPLPVAAKESSDGFDWFGDASFVQTQAISGIDALKAVEAQIHSFNEKIRSAGLTTHSLFKKAGSQPSFVQTSSRDFGRRSTAGFKPQNRPAALASKGKKSPFASAWTSGNQKHVINKGAKAPVAMVGTNMRPVAGVDHATIAANSKVFDAIDSAKRKLSSIADRMKHIFLQVESKAEGWFTKAKSTIFGKFAF